MAQTGEHKLTYTIPGSRANLYSFVLFAVALLLFGIPYILLWDLASLRLAFVSFLTRYVLLAATVAAGVVAHEGLHAVTFAYFCKKGWQSVSFGLAWTHLAPWVHCSEDLSVKQYAIATLMPGLVLGVVPCAVALVTGIGWFLVFGLFFTAGSASDLLSVADLRFVPRGALVRDHPKEAGFEVRPPADRKTSGTENAN